MADYAQIASVIIQRKREDGSLRRWEFLLSERGGDPDTLSIPIEGEVYIDDGSEGADLAKSIVPARVSFSLKDKSALAGRLIDSGYRQFKLVINELESGDEAFSGYILDEFHEYDIFNSVKVVSFVATGQLGELQKNPAGLSTHSIMTEFQLAGQDMELERPVDFYTGWRHDGQAVDDPIPNYISINEVTMLGGERGSRLEVIKQMCQQFNFQVFQRKGRLVVADVHELMTNPEAVNTYRNTSSTNFTQETTDVLIELDENNTIRFPKGKAAPRIVSVVQQMVMPRRRIFTGPSIADQLIDFQDTSFTAETEGLAVAGEIFRLETASGRLKANSPLSSPVSGQFKALQIIFESALDGTVYYYNSTTGSWSETEFYVDPQFSFFTLETAGQEFTWSYIPRDLPPIPDDEMGKVRIEAHFQISAVDGDPSDVIENFITEIRLSVKLNESSDNVYYPYAATAAGAGELLVFNFYQGDDLDYAANQAISVFHPGQGSTIEASEWVDGAGTDSFGAISAARKADLLLGRSDRIHVIVRDTIPVDMLSVIDFTEGGQTKRCRPVAIRHALFAGFIEVWMKPAPGEAYDQNEGYTLAEAKGTMGSSGGGTGSAGSGGGFFLNPAIDFATLDQRYLRQSQHLLDGDVAAIRRTLGISFSHESLGITIDDLNGNYTELNLRLTEPIRTYVEHIVLNKEELSEEWGGRYPITPFDPDYEEGVDDPEERVQSYGPGVVSVPIAPQRIVAPAGSDLLLSGAQKEVDALKMEAHVNYAGGDAYSALFMKSEIETNANGLATAATALTAIENHVNLAGGSAYSALNMEARLTTTEDGLDTQGIALTALENHVNLAGGSAYSALNMESRITVTDGQITEISSKAALVVGAGGAVGSINLTADGLTGFSQISLKASQLLLNGVVFDDGAGLIRSTDFDALNEVGWRLTGGSSSKMEISNIEIWGGSIKGITFTGGQIGAVRILSSLPGSGAYNGEVVYLTSDEKIYRWNGSDWIKAVDGGDLVENSVTAQAISVVTLSAINTSTGNLSVTGTLLLGGNGLMTNDDDDFSISDDGIGVAASSAFDGRRAFRLYSGSTVQAEMWYQSSGSNKFYLNSRQGIEITAGYLESANPANGASITIRAYHFLNLGGNIFLDAELDLTLQSGRHANFQVSNDFTLDANNIVFDASGRIVFLLDSLPTSDPLYLGQVWRSSGQLMVSETT